MSQQLSLKETEQRVFKATYSDGLLDLFLGLLILTTGTGPVMGGMELPIPLILLIMLPVAGILTGAHWAAKRYLVQPRMGLVRLGKTSRARLSKTRRVLYISVAVGVITLLIAGFRMLRVDNALTIIMLIWAVQSLTVFSLGAYFMSTPRYYAYGVLFAIAMPLGFALLVRTENVWLLYVPIAAAALVATSIGLVLFVRFLKENPLSNIELE